jgi:hypothetical protein
MAQALTDRRPRRLTEELRSISTNWKSLPLTMGLLVALILGAIFIASAVRGYHTDLSAQIDRAIKAHSNNVTAHQHIRDEIRDQMEQMRQLIHDFARDIEQRRGKKWKR